MNRIKQRVLIGLGLSIGICGGQTQANEITRAGLGQITNRAAILDVFENTTLVIHTQEFSLPPHLRTNTAFGTNEVVQRLRTNIYVYTNAAFVSFLPNSLANLIWTNFIAHTNGREMRIWSERKFPVDFPTNPPTAKWNEKSLIWDMHGMTALSPAWAGQGAVGQVPLTALTRRHAYTRGHGMGENGISLQHAGRKAWFLTAANKLIEVKVKRSAVRTTSIPGQTRQDYSILLFDRDLPPGIQPMSVASLDDTLNYYLAATRSPVPLQGMIPCPLLQSEQTGSVSTGIPPLSVNTWKGGDSGSPNMIPLPGRLVFVSGRSTTGPTPEMQADMDELCRLEGLDPAQYQMHWIDLKPLDDR